MEGNVVHLGSFRPEPCKIASEIRNRANRLFIHLGFDEVSAVNYSTLISSSLVSLYDSGIDHNIHLFCKGYSKSQSVEMIIPADICDPVDLKGRVLCDEISVRNVFSVESVVLTKFMEPKSPEECAEIIEGAVSIFWRKSRSELMSDLESTNAKLTLVNESLEETVSKRTSQLAAVNSQLNSAFESAVAESRAKSVFLATMSHEIRTPMNGVVGLLDVLENTQLTDDQREIIGTVRSSAFSLLAIINDILDYSKIESGKVELVNRTFDLSRVVESVTEGLAAAAQKKSVRISLYLDPEVPDFVVGDEHRVRQVITNIVGNAVKFTHMGTVSVACHSESRDGRDLQLRIEVRDSGVGIRQDQIARIFNPFIQADGDTTRRFGGTGLGLPICKQLVDAMGGSIEVESVLNEGSVFDIRIPFELPETQEHIRVYDFSDTHVLIVTTDIREGTLDGRLIEFYGASVDVKDNFDELFLSGAGDLDFDDLRHKLQQYDAVIFGPGIALDKIGDIIACLSFHEWFEYRFLAMNDDRRAKDKLDAPNLMLVSSGPLRRSVFLDDFSNVLGLSSPALLGQDVPSIEVMGARHKPSVEDAEDAGQLVLVAEDNSTNQMVIVRQLAMLGYACLVAEDGLVAEKLLAERRIALLLTDCHMPNLDGFELARHVRALEKLRGTPRLPIVAATASVMEQEIRSCLESGMDFVLKKPLQAIELDAALQEFLPYRDIGGAQDLVAMEVPERGAADEVEVASEQSEVSMVDDASVLDLSVLRGVVGDSEELVREVLLDFVESLSVTRDQVSDALLSERAQDVQMASHRLKSAARSVGALTLGAICERIEKFATSGDMIGANSLIEDFTGEAEAVALEVQRILKV